MEQKHTPGPWRVKESGGCVIGPNKTICQTIAIEDGPLSISPEVEANARLIAAAPKLLAACKKALIRCENEWPKELHHEFRYLKEAIHEAK